MNHWEKLQKEIVGCDKCPRLREHCLAIAQEKRAAFREWDYWGKPIPNMGSPDARVLIVGLAPAAHGANRTGRMFTGDRSGDFLFRALHDTGFATQATSVRAGDGLELKDLAITAMAHCAPPANKPTPGEIENCFEYFERTVEAMKNLRCVVALGRIAFDGCVRLYRSRGWLPAGPRPGFGHGKVYRSSGAPALLASFHPSQQNTFTGKLTPGMMREVFRRARKVIEMERA